MVRGAWVSLCVRAMCELVVVGALDEPRSLAELAARTSSDPASPARLLRVLVDLGLVVATDDGRYTATPRGEVLRLDHPSGVRSLALMQTVVPNLTAWQHLGDAIRSGDAGYERLHGLTLWSWLAASGGGSDLQRVDGAAARLAGRRITSRPRLLRSLSGRRRRRRPGCHAGRSAHAGTVGARDGGRPARGRPAATVQLSEAGLGGRARGEPADFFDSVPTGGDVYVVSNALHDWHDPDAVSILRGAHRHASGCSPSRRGARARCSRANAVAAAGRPPRRPAHAGDVRRAGAHQAGSTTISWSPPASGRPTSRPRRRRGTS
jgi:hypothetical protein